MFPSPTRLLLTAVVATVLSTIPAHVSAHGAMSSPKVTFLDPSNRNAPSALPAGPAGPYTGNAVLKDLAEASGSHCGKTNPDAEVQPIPSDGVVQLSISAAHIGPCEVWLDDEKVASAKNCVTEYPDRKIPVDFTRCQASGCLVRWVWLATHNSPWEIFDNCARVGNRAGGATATTTSSPSTTPPASTTSAPTAQPTSATGSGNDTSVPGTVVPSGMDGATYRGVDNTPAMKEWCTNNCERGFCPDSVCMTEKK
jgi:hypothetical protein